MGIGKSNIALCLIKSPIIKQVQDYPFPDCINKMWMLGWGYEMSNFHYGGKNAQKMLAVDL